MPEQRAHYENLARKSGYEPVDAVTKELSLLVAADISSASSKLDKAKTYSVKIQSLNDWLKTQPPHTSAEKPAKEKTSDTPNLFDLKM
jgi:NAD-dependent DNA ligase